MKKPLIPFVATIENLYSQRGKQPFVRALGLSQRSIFPWGDRNWKNHSIKKKQDGRHGDFRGFYYIERWVALIFVKEAAPFLCIKELHKYILNDDNLLMKSSHAYMGRSL